MKLTPQEIAIIQCALEDYREKRLAAAIDYHSEKAEEAVKIINRLLDRIGSNADLLEGDVV